MGKRDTDITSEFTSKCMSERRVLTKADTIHCKVIPNIQDYNGITSELPG